MNRRIHPLAIAAAVASAAIIAACAVPVHAASFSPARSVSVPRVAPRPAVAPTPVAKPAPRVINKTTNNTTVIKQTRVIQATPAQSSGSGWLGNMAASMAGATAGSMIGNWLSRPSEGDGYAKQAAAVQQAPVQPQLAPAVEHAVPPCDATIYNCEKKVKQ